MHITIFGGVVALFFAVQLYAFRRAGQGWGRFLPAAATAVGLLLFIIVPSVFGAALPGGYFSALIAVFFGAGFIGCLLGLAAAVLTRRS